MKKTNLLIMLYLLSFIQMSAQVTKLANNNGLHGILVGNKPILQSVIDKKFWTTDGTSDGTKSYTSDVFEFDPFFYGTEMGGKFYFKGLIQDISVVDELWVTDGTTGGTNFLQHPVYPDWFGSGPSDFKALNDSTILFFTQYTTHHQLLKSDGTKEGTVMLKDNIAPDDNINTPDGGDIYLQNLDGSMFFFANDKIHGEELWKTDGTEAGTIMVKDINPGSKSSYISVPGSSGLDFDIVYHGNIFFSANDGTYGRELWKTDGTSTGTVLVKNISGSDSGTYIFDFKIINDKLTFRSQSENSIETKLWVTDGTEQGTIQLLNDKISPVPNSVILGNKMLFGASNNTDISSLLHGWELWETDGTVGNTKILKVFKANSQTFAAGFNQFMLQDKYNSDVSIRFYDQIGVWNGKVFFKADDGEHGVELWKTDGTTGGTELVKDIYPGSNTSFGSYNTNDYGDNKVMFAQDKFFFYAKPDEATGFELFESDGTSDGTKLIQDINPGPNSSDVRFQFIYNNQLYFSASDGDNGDENNYLSDLYKIDATSTTIVSIANGNWNNPGTWDGGVVPSSTSNVIVRHNVLVTANASSYSLTVQPPSGNLVVQTGFVLQILH